MTTSTPTPTPMGNMALSDVLDGFTAGTYTKQQVQDWFSLFLGYQAYIHSAAMGVQEALISKFGVISDLAWLGDKSYAMAHAMWEAGKRSGDILPTSPAPGVTNSAVSADNVVGVPAPAVGQV